MAFLKLHTAKRHHNGYLEYDPKGKTVWINPNHIQLIVPYPARTVNGKHLTTEGTVIAVNHSDTEQSYEVASNPDQVIAAVTKALHEQRIPFIECPTGKPEDPPAEKQPEAKPPAGTAPAA